MSDKELVEKLPEIISQQLNNKNELQDKQENGSSSSGSSGNGSEKSGQVSPKDKKNETASNPTKEPEAGFR